MAAVAPVAMAILVELAVQATAIAEGRVVDVDVDVAAVVVAVVKMDVDVVSTVASIV